MRVRFSPGLPVRRGIIYMWKFIQEVREELKHVIWPSREEVVKSTWIILLTVIALSIFLFMIDFVFEKVFEFLVNLGTK
ncbi:MAG: preprotein translocase subunit SecE [Leptonema sp. (in: bacteria)]